MAIITCPNCGAKNRIDEWKAAQAQPKCGRCGTTLGSASAASGEPLVVTDTTFAREVLSVSGKPILVDCWAPWCGPCRMLEPTIKQLAAESGGRYVIAKLNTDENQRTASQSNDQCATTAPWATEAVAAKTQPAATNIELDN